MISIDNENLDYPITVEIPEDYWVYSHNVVYETT